MQIHDNITELYYRESFGMDEALFYDNVCVNTELMTVRGDRQANEVCADSVMRGNFIHTQILLSGRIGSVVSEFLLLSSSTLTSTTSSLGTIEPQAKDNYRASLDASERPYGIIENKLRSGFEINEVGMCLEPTNNYPTTNVLNLLLVIGAWVFCVWDRFLGLFAVKNILTLNRNTKTINYTGN